MGMDVYGNKPTSQAGEYFRANIWSWRPIHALMMELCSDMLSAQLLGDMSYNDGAGPADQETCTEMADRFAAWLSANPNGHVLESTDLRVDKTGRFVDSGASPSNADIQTFSPYCADAEHVQEWIAFLRHCGGFSVW